MQTEKVYRALLSQSDSDDPVAVVLENSLGDVTLSRYNSGAYTLSLANAFPANRTWLNVVKATLATITSAALFYRSDDDTLTLETQVDGVSNDGVLSSTSIEIRVYPSTSISQEP